MRWSLATRVAFRFCFVYFALYSLATQIVGGLLLVPGFSFPAWARSGRCAQITSWFATHLFGVTAPLVYTGNSGDTISIWVQTFWLLRRRGDRHGRLVGARPPARTYVTLHKWFRLFVRLALAAQMFYYGMAKIIPTQFPAPSLVTLVEPVGNLSLTDLLWTFIGASPPYQIFTGVAEVWPACCCSCPARRCSAR